MSSLFLRLSAIGRTAALGAALMLLTTPAFADPISVGDYIKFLGSTSSHPSNNGGAFQIDILSNGPGFDFLTFCLQRTQYIDYSQSFRVGGITNFADDSAGNDPLDSRTEWVYSNFRRGLLGAFNVNEIQAAIWILENEWSTNVGGSASLITLAQNAITAGWTNDGVQVLNLFYSNGTRAQDQLTYSHAPEPASLLLLGSGLTATVVAARRRRKKQAPAA